MMEHDSEYVGAGPRACPIFADMIGRTQKTNLTGELREPCRGFPKDRNGNLDPQCLI